MELKNIAISDINSDGLGVGRSEDFAKVLFVKGGIIGDNVDVLITKDKKNFAFADIVKINKPSSYRESPKCVHFGNCGGCLLQGVSRDGQLILKEKRIKDAILKIAEIEDAKIDEITPSDKQFEYRNKMYFSFSELAWITNEEENKERRVLGLHTFGRFDRVLNIKECLLSNPKINEIRNFIREFCISKNASFWNPKTKKGVMRDLICKTDNNEKISVIIIFGERPGVLQAELCMALKNTFKQDISSINWGVNGKDTSPLEDTKFYGFTGEDWTIQSLLGLQFKISLKSFSQVNNGVVEKIISSVLEAGNFNDNSVVYDLYCGIGTFSLHVAKIAKKVVGIELSESAIRDAKENAEINGIKNIKFIKGKVEEVLNQEFTQENGVPEVLVVDPPRSGLEKKALKKILELDAQKILYVSCNPASFARDALDLKERYNLLKVLPFDMFPQTMHVELLAIFEKK